MVAGRPLMPLWIFLLLCRSSDAKTCSSNDKTKIDAWCSQSVDPVAAQLPPGDASRWCRTKDKTKTTYACQSEEQFKYCNGVYQGGGLTHLYGTDPSCDTNPDWEFCQDTYDKRLYRQSQWVPGCLARKGSSTKAKAWFKEVWPWCCVGGGGTWDGDTMGPIAKETATTTTTKLTTTTQGIPAVVEQKNDPPPSCMAPKADYPWKAEEFAPLKQCLLSMCDDIDSRIIDWIGCTEIMQIARCEEDYSKHSPKVPKGTLVSDVCPNTCCMCGPCTFINKDLEERELPAGVHDYSLITWGDALLLSSIVHGDMVIGGGLFRGTATGQKNWAKCPWVDGDTGSADVVQCFDGGYCDTLKDGWECCLHKGGIGKCPPNYPQLCTSMECAGGQDHCCSKDCKPLGGILECIMDKGAALGDTVVGGVLHGNQDWMFAKFQHKLLGDVFTWYDFERLAKTTETGTDKRDGRIVVMSTGGKWNLGTLNMGDNDPEHCGPNLLVIFNTDEDVELSCAKGETGVRMRTFGPSILAPFSSVTLDCALDGVMIVKHFRQIESPETKDYDLYANGYVGKLFGIKGELPGTTAVPESVGIPHSKGCSRVKVDGYCGLKGIPLTTSARTGVFPNTRPDVEMCATMVRKAGKLAFTMGKYFMGGFCWASPIDVDLSVYSMMMGIGTCPEKEGWSHGDIYDFYVCRPETNGRVVGDATDGVVATVKTSTTVPPKVPMYLLMPTTEPGLKTEPPKSLCETAGDAGLGPGFACVFPFVWQGAVYDECAFDEEGDFQGFWCPTKTHPNNEPVEDEWGKCSETCFPKQPTTLAPTLVGGTTSGCSNCSAGYNIYASLPEGVLRHRSRDAGYFLLGSVSFSLIWLFIARVTARQRRSNAVLPSRQISLSRSSDADPERAAYEQVRGIALLES